MVEIEFVQDKLVLHIKGFDKVLAFKSTIEVPLSHVTSVELGVDRAAWDEMRSKLHRPMTGSITQHLVAGTFDVHGASVFWDVHDVDKAITIGIDHEKLSKLFIEVADPSSAASAIRSKMRK